ncbi:hypothetical protein F4Y59_13720 [Candidatus Poribacteria bacterium]|nr:hypothetical protein [Candidatus Poribacteria bacterium]MYK19034.1 hypothetical protein [Candidatus Poribacteria bacterium]
MFHRLLSKNRFFMALVLVLVFVASGLLYLNTVKRQATRDIQSTQERVNAPKPPPPGETAESGHWHGDVWHAEPHEAHTPVNSPALVQENFSGEVRGESAAVALVNAQVAAPNQEASAPTQETSARMQTFHEAHHAWREKYHELIDQYSQLNREMSEVFPKTVEEWKQYNANSEMWRRYNELWAKQAKIDAKLKALEQEMPSPPTQ